MAEIVVGLVGPAIELAKCIVAPIKRQFNYLCCFSSNIRNLRDEAKKLDDGREGLQGRVTIDENNAQVIVPQVKSWLEKANSEIEVNLVEIESEIRNIQIGCFAIKSRFSLSRRAKKTSAYMKELRDNCNIDPISHPPPPASTVPTLVRPTYELESRKRIEDNIMITLRDNKVNIMGIYGMGGVGKTTMAQKIVNRSKNERLFDESIMATVSQQVDKLGIQRELAENLGMKLEDESLSSRANILHRRLTGGKRILIVLDDVWKRLNLEELGIPCDESGSKDCTILLTSRDRGVLGEMEAKSIGEIQTLSQEEAWSLFQEKVGACAADQNLQSIAQEIANECKGLPVALVNVAGALKDQKDKSIWEDALEQLKSSNPIDLPSILSEVYRPLKLSYDFLDSPHAGSIFLLCCLFPEDYDIPLKYLTVYAMGLNMFEGIMNLKQARNRTKRLISTLKSRSLLLEGSSENHVRMHDVVRDVAIFIASEERRIHEGNDCTWICPFLGERFKLSMGSIFPNLQLLLIEKPADEKLQIDDSFFEGMRELNVLSIAYYSFISLP